MATKVDDQLRHLREKFTASGQDQVFRFLDRLNDAQKQQLLHDVSDIHLDEIERMKGFLKSDSDAKIADNIGPFTHITDSTTAPKETLAKWYETGLRLIADNKVALLLMGGGQGTRLGFNKPKGLYDIGLPSHKSLLQIQAERLVRVKFLAARLAGKDVAAVSIPWYIMTSDFTHEETMDYFASNNYFGLPKSDFFFFQQGALPCLDADGKIILSEMHRVATAPNGNGGVYSALLKCGAIDDMRKRGIQFVHGYCVDNVLVKVADPRFIGFCASSGADCVNKVVRKDVPTEPVGVMCMRNGKPGVIEYSEIPKSLAEMKADNGYLVYNAANIAIHFWTVPFLEKLATAHLPFHLAFKAIPHVTADGTHVTPPKPNGYKMEMFVFDVFPLANKVLGYLVLRDGEFSALKNAVGPGVSSTAETARRDVTVYHASLVEAAGGHVDRTGNPDAAFEISPLTSYEGEDLEPLVKNRTFRVPFELIAK